MCFKLHGLRAGLVGMDPFVGIGNSALAAQELSLSKFIGFDIDPYYVTVAREKTTL
jgi:site-specific DNA-methyltransferase (adenine-specific)